MKADPPGHIVMTFWRTGDRKKVLRTSKSGVEIRNRSDTKNGNQKGIELLNSNNRSMTLCLQIQRENSPHLEFHTRAINQVWVQNRELFRHATSQKKKKFLYVSCLRKWQDDALYQNKGQNQERRQPEHPETGKIQCSIEARGMPKKMAI